MIPAGIKQCGGLLQVLMRLAAYMGSQFLPLAARTFPAWRRLVQGHERAVHKPRGARHQTRHQTRQSCQPLLVPASASASQSSGPVARWPEAAAVAAGATLCQQPGCRAPAMLAWMASDLGLMAWWSGPAADCGCL